MDINTEIETNTTVKEEEKVEPIKAITPEYVKIPNIYMLKYIMITNVYEMCM